MTTETVIVSGIIETLVDSQADMLKEHTSMERRVTKMENDGPPTEIKIGPGILETLLDSQKLLLATLKSMERRLLALEDTVFHPAEPPK